MEIKDLYGIPLSIGDEILIKVDFYRNDTRLRKATIESFGKRDGFDVVMLKDVKFLPTDDVNLSHRKVNPKYRYANDVVRISPALWKQTGTQAAINYSRSALIDAISASFDTEKNIDVSGCYMQDGTIVAARYTRLVRKDGNVAVECALKDITDDDLTEATENLAVLTFNELYDIWKAIKNN